MFALPLEVVIEERQLDVLLKEVGRVRAEVDMAEAGGVFVRPGTVRPGADDHHVEDAGVLLLDRLVGAEGAVQVLGIVPAADRHHGGGDLLEVGQEIAVLPELVVSRMGYHLVPEGDLVLVKARVDVLQGADVEEEAIAILRAVFRVRLALGGW